jgi:hypothetical protein
VGWETRRGLELLGAGFVLGVLADLLLRATPLGLGLALWSLAFAAALSLVARSVAWWTAAPLVVFGVLVAWRDSPWLVALDLFALTVAVAVGAAARVRRAGLVDYVVGLADASTGAFLGPTVLLDEVEWSELRRDGRADHVAAAGRGALIALPLVGVFGALFVASDAVFGHYLRGLKPSPHALVHLAVVAGGGWVAAGLLRQLRAPRGTAVAVPRLGQLGVVEIAVALALVNALFLAFVLVQIEAFVGGRSFVESHAHVTYSSYARSGFFELVAVAALVLPVVLLADWWTARPSRAVRALSASLVVLVLAVMAVLWAFSVLRR